MTGSRFSERLLEEGLLRSSDLVRAEEVRARAGGRLPATLARLGIVSEADIARIVSDLYSLPIASSSDVMTGPHAIALNRRFLERKAAKLLDLRFDTVVLGTADPGDHELQAAVEFATGMKTELRVMALSDVADEIGIVGNGEEEFAGITSDFASATESDVERLLEGESDAPVIRLVQRVLAGAVNRRASDVHIEPMARHLIVRYRIDGRLIEADRFPDSLAAPIASRIKVMAGLDIAESRLPQDGRLRLTVRGQDIDVRVSTSPTAWGESVVLRLLGRSEVPLDLDRLGLPPAALAKLNRALDRPHGIILLTGPTGSGKTTTLYAAINRLRRPEVKILTVEDPVEVLLEGINQVQVRPEIDLSYAATLRAFLRQDPDILMIGEIRDGDTAEIALRAALTGHLVLSTLHTNSAAGAFTRLNDIGVEPYLAASTVIASIAQRLVRSLCADCRTARPVGQGEAALFAALDIAPPSEIYEPKGCGACQGSGYTGRVPIMEILEVDEELRMLIRDRCTDSMVDRRPAGESLRGHGLFLVATGRTSLAEVERAVELT